MSALRGTPCSSRMGQIESSPIESLDTPAFAVILSGSVNGVFPDGKSSGTRLAGTELN